MNIAPPRCHAVFAYGTLMRGQSRAGCWPYAPRHVSRARTRGILYDLGEYPALILGDGWVAGEIWELSPDHVEASLAALDDVEDAPYLYVRTVAEIYDESGTPRFAYVYLYADIQGSITARRIPADADGVQHWIAPTEP